MSRPTMADETIKLTDDRRKALNLAIIQIEKTCGKGSIMQHQTPDAVSEHA